MKAVRILVLTAMFMLILTAVAFAKEPNEVMIGRWSAHEQGEANRLDMVVDITACDAYWNYEGTFTIDAVIGPYTLHTSGRVLGAVGDEFGLYFDTYETDHPYARKPTYDYTRIAHIDWYAGTWDVGYAVLAYEGAIDFEALDAPGQGDIWAQSLEGIWFDSASGFGLDLIVGSAGGIDGRMLCAAEGGIAGFASIDWENSQLNFETGMMYIRMDTMGSAGPGAQKVGDAFYKTYLSIYAKLSDDGQSMVVWQYEHDPQQTAYDIVLTKVE